MSKYVSNLSKNFIHFSIICLMRTQSSSFGLAQKWNDFHFRKNSLNCLLSVNFVNNFTYKCSGLCTKAEEEVLFCIACQFTLSQFCFMLHFFLGKKACFRSCIQFKNLIQKYAAFYPHFSHFSCLKAFKMGFLSPTSAEVTFDAFEFCISG